MFSKRSPILVLSYMLRLLFFSSTFFAASSTPASLDDVFSVRQSGGGNCNFQDKHGYSYKDNLDLWWEDSRKLTNHVLNVLGDVAKVAASDREGTMMRRNLKAWFGLAFDAQTNMPATTASEMTMEKIRGKYA